jgi:hypothetical protein
METGSIFVKMTVTYIDSSQGESFLNASVVLGAVHADTLRSFPVRPLLLLPAFP